VSFRPDLVACWPFRSAPAGIQILLLRRAQGRIYPGIWQPVTGRLEDGERIVDGALRELVEETGIDAAGIEVLFGLDQVNLFHADYLDALQAEAVFAAQVRPGVEAILSHEHDAQRWVAPAEARELVLWPAYRGAIEQIEWIGTHPDRTGLLRVGAWAIDGSAPPPSSAPPPAPPSR
jgi:8-oxo-dGTP pyrophosphatase MutT (NUDIX family)